MKSNLRSSTVNAMAAPGSAGGKVVAGAEPAPRRSPPRPGGARGRGRGGGARGLLAFTDPLYLRRLAREVRRAVYRGSAYYCGIRIWRVRFHQGRIQFQRLSDSANSWRPRWQWAMKPEGFTDGRHDICASRQLPRKRGAR